MEVPAERGSMDVKTLISLYSNKLWNRIINILPFSHSNFLGKISSLYLQAIRTRSRRRRPSLPLPLPSHSLDTSVIPMEASRVFDVLEDILEHLFLNLHNIQKNLQFWQSRAEESNARKAYFMIFERGPRAFITRTVQFIRESVAQGSSLQLLSQSASAHISERITILTSLRYSLATFLAQVHIDIDKFGEELVNDPEKSLSSLLVTINGLFSKLEAAIGHLHATRQSDSSVDGSYSFPLVFEKLPDVNQEGSQWTDCEIRDAINLIYQNLYKLDSYLSILILSIRDELFETFRKRHRSVMELEDVQLTANSLHRMLLTFSEQTQGQKFPEHASDQQMLEIVMARYEKELMHPIQNLLKGELAHALLIQIQKLKLDIETAMLELNQILRANEINFAILAALPAFFVSLLLIMLVRAWVKQDTRAEGRGRVARIQRRLLVVEVEKWIMQYQTCMNQGKEKDAQCMFGMVLYSLDRLYRAVERHAKATGEWLCLRQDIVELAKPGLDTASKLILTARMERVYDCLLPSLKRQ
ncbi:protein DGS1, mitochondrial isoform X2 [Vitis vinifera]|uniref:protein DGS1, mitochondrial isoform X2 n=1 Tax=Vitis vinifera TaxID=29760 RepID=UPI00053F2BC0|nr:protein DGS1, mitochondrial isoform X2 [Vitis vinifera]|eukprot:XP_010651562.1 PREDICTED: protein DGS1, mitochondrial isoform X2 [Vitis vinifera]